jgi:hypothetical protein
VQHAAELERQDRAVAAELETLVDIADRAGEIRARGGEVRAALERLPRELEEVARRTREAETEAEVASEQSRLAAERLAALERARRRKVDEIERAQREAETARERLADAHAQIERLRALRDRLRGEERSLREEGADLTGVAAGIAAELRRVPRVGDDAAAPPGDTLAELEDWGLLVRSALLVARGTLEAERERIVAEANVLGAAALSEPLAASSVALVRRRLEEQLG